MINEHLIKKQKVYRYLSTVFLLIGVIGLLNIVSIYVTDLHNGIVFLVLTNTLGKIGSFFTTIASVWLGWFLGGLYFNEKQHILKKQINGSFDPVKDIKTLQILKVALGIFLVILLFPLLFLI